MNLKYKFALGVVAFGVMITFAIIAFNFLQEGNEPDSFAEAREQAPNFTFEDADGNLRQLSDFIGTPVVLNFWASWCPACVVEMPYFNEFYQEYGDRVHFLKINLADGVRETQAGVRDFMYENGFTTPLLFDIDGARAYGVRGIPVTFYIDADGYAVAMSMGAQDRDRLQQGLDAILN